MDLSDAAYKAKEHDLDELNKIRERLKIEIEGTSDRLMRDAYEESLNDVEKTIKKISPQLFQMNIIKNLATIRG